MHERIEWTPVAVADLRRIDRRTREHIRQAMYRYAETGYGDMRQLRRFHGEQRLRVGDWRVLFTRDAEALVRRFIRVLPGGDVYRANIVLSRHHHTRKLRAYAFSEAAGNPFVMSLY